jgi:hypothetical protein
MVDLDCQTKDVGIDRSGQTARSKLTGRGAGSGHIVLCHRNVRPVAENR